MAVLRWVTVLEVRHSPVRRIEPEGVEAPGLVKCLPKAAPSMLGRSLPNSL